MTGIYKEAEKLKLEGCSVQEYIATDPIAAAYMPAAAVKRITKKRIATGSLDWILSLGSGAITPCRKHTTKQPSG